MKICKRFSVLIIFTFLIIFSAACSSTSSSQGEADYPTKEIKLIVHTSAGGPTDTMARKLAEQAEPILGQKIVIENKPGGSGATQMAALKAGDSDGYTLATITPSHVGGWNSNLKGQYSPDDFAFVSRVQLDPYIIAVNAESEFETLEDLVTYMKDHPGELKVGGYGSVGSGHNIAWNIFADAAGVDAVWTNYESTTDAVTALLGNHVDIANSNPEIVKQYVDSGKLRVLGVLSDKRLESMPDVPTYEEGGVDVSTKDWAQFRGIYTNADVPEDVLDKLSSAFSKAMETQEFKQYMQDAMMEPGDMDHDEFTEFINQQMKVNDEWLTKLGIN
ncbi:Bug family tripartite tricarboxylate transporter substrate binding protein [Pseudalkalibacillus salsuginis]|uniref:Bug family tripartite tricarboxylate transporter substrate binding protein n=1 Tax=Pseudalkalibacillus salsuginis TaxID=2910972 RepID=UPI001F1B6180|nr:tripartite tricarboxylate transporter substrate binding protein [Pseudalkalibacillus salsuginis]MCF6411594.1 tripartite tricarboxylate transporter substrate binding protein [Pseudalkalibacillus salsuginis]